MIQTTGRVLKSSDVEVEGRFSLDLGHAAGPGQYKNPAGDAKVKILENQNEFAVMEVTCCCGRKTIIRCDYSGAAAVKNTESPGAVNRGAENKS